MEKTPMIFAKGVQFYKPRDGAPETIKGNLVINLKEFKEFITEQKLENVVRLDLRKSKEKGTLYLSLNTWKPEKPAGFTSDISKKHTNEQGEESPW